MANIRLETLRPLKWPDGWPRTRLQDRKTQAAWKKSYDEVVVSLERELERLKVTSYQISHNDRVSPDSGVAVFFSLKPTEDYAWQEALGFIGEVPTVQQIDRAYMERAKRVHPDGPTPDLEMFNTLTKHRDRAKAWARGEQTIEHEKVIACDVFKEVRLNLQSIKLTIAALRQIERCGASLMMERAFRGFNKSLAAGTSGAAKDVTAIA